jgi:cytochrome b
MSGPFEGAKRRERVWDPFVRVFHWSLVAAFVTAWLGKGEAVIHENAGMVVLALIIFRTAWGIIGPGSARFETFVRSPAVTLEYILSIFRGKPKHYLGHNPAGAAMILLMLATLAATTASGILMTTTALWGNGLVEYIHGISAYLMLFLIGGHILGVLLAAIQHRENLPLSMITGKKWVPDFATRHLGKMRLTPKRLAIAAAMVAASAAVWTGSSAALNASIWRLHKSIAHEAKTSGCTVRKIHGPVISVFPQVHVEYAVAVQGRDMPIDVRLDASTAIQRKPDLKLERLTAECRTIAARIENIKATSTGAMEMATRALPQSNAESGAAQTILAQPAPPVASTPVVRAVAASLAQPSATTSDVNPPAQATAVRDVQMDKPPGKPPAMARAKRSLRQSPDFQALGVTEAKRARKAAAKKRKAGPKALASAKKKLKRRRNSKIIMSKRAAGERRSDHGNPGHGGDDHDGNDNSGPGGGDGGNSGPGGGGD